VNFERPRDLVCVDCGGTFSVNARSAREVAAGRRVFRCELCRAVDVVPDPEPDDYAYWATLPPEELDDLVAAIASLRPC
jgi:hypothetical protein